MEIVRQAFFHIWKLYDKHFFHIWKLKDKHFWETQLRLN